MIVFAWHESALVLKLAVIELAILFRLMFPSFPVASVFPSVEIGACDLELTTVSL